MVENKILKTKIEKNWKKSVVKKSVEKKVICLMDVEKCVKKFSLIRKGFPELSPYIPFYCLNSPLHEKWAWSQKIVHESP